MIRGGRIRVIGNAPNVPARLARAARVPRGWRDRMRRTLRIAIPAVATLLIATPGAHAAVTVTHHEEQHDPPNGPVATGLTLLGDAADDDVTISREQDGRLLLSRDGGGIVAAALPCEPVGADVRCPAVQALSADLREGVDKLSAPTVTVPMTLAGGDGNDTLTGGLAGDVLAGGAGIDTLNGGPGIDEYFGEADADVIVSRDGVPERISCGTGDDRVDNDFTDIIAECERGTDTDGDGFSTAVDCDDAARERLPRRAGRRRERRRRGLRRPGRPEPGPRRRRLPGAARLQRRRPGDPARHVRDPRQRRRRELRPAGAAVRAAAPRSSRPSGACAGPTSRLRKLIVRNAPAGARVAVTCDGPGCAFDGRKTVRVERDLAPVRLHRFFGKGRLRAGARVQVTITADGVIGRRYTLQDRAQRAPGGRRSAAWRPARRGTAMLMRRLIAPLCAAAALVLWRPPARMPPRSSRSRARRWLRRRPGRHRPDRRIRDAHHDPHHAFGAPRSARRRAASSCRATPNTVDCRKDGVTVDRPQPRRRQRRRLGQPVDQDPGDLQRRRRQRRPVRRRRASTSSTAATGDDNIVSRDGRAEHGRLRRRATTPRSPTTATSASRARRSRATPTATASAARPTATTRTRGSAPASTDVPDNGVDEDCSGVDAINLDRDGDGSPRPQDCDDTERRDPARRPRGDRQRRRRELRHAHPAVPAAVGLGQRHVAGVGNRTRNLTLLAKDFPKGTVITLRCLRSPACPGKAVTRRVKRKGATLNLHASLGQSHVRLRRPHRAAHQPHAADRPAAPLPDHQARRAGRRVPVRAARRARRTLLGGRRGRVLRRERGVDRRCRRSSPRSWRASCRRSGRAPRAPARPCSPQRAVVVRRPRARARSTRLRERVQRLAAGRPAAAARAQRRDDRPASPPAPAANVACAAIE